MSVVLRITFSVLSGKKIGTQFQFEPFFACEGNSARSRDSNIYSITDRGGFTISLFSAAAQSFLLFAGNITVIFENQ
jgi:hypothetical protein